MKLKLFTIVFLIQLFSLTSMAIAQPLLEKVNIQLKWKHQFQFAGYYAAIEKGFYKEQGLDVTLIETAPGKSHMDQVLMGNAQYGTDNSGLVVSRLAGLPVVLVAQIFQHSPVTIATLRSSGLTTPWHLVKEKIQITNDGFTNDAPALAMLVQAGANLEELQLEYGQADLSKLLSGEVAAISLYSTTIANWNNNNIIKLDQINPADYGFDFYGDNLFTTADEVKNHPDRVEKIRAATLKGWKYAIANKGELIDIIKTKYDTQKIPKDRLLLEAIETQLLIDPTEFYLGEYKISKYQRIAQIYKSIKVTQTSNLDKRFFYGQNKKRIISLTPEEKDWLKKNPTITVQDSDFPPYSFTEEPKKGVAIDILKIIAKEYNFNLDFIDTPFGDTLEEMRQGKGPDILPVAQINHRRRNFLNFSPPYAKSSLLIYIRNDEKLIHSIKDLRDKTVAIPKGFSTQKTLARDFPNIKILTVNTFEDSIKVLSAGKVDAILSLPEIITQKLRQLNIDNIVIAGASSLKPVQVSFASRVDSPILNSILTKGYSSIPEKDLNDINNKYLELIHIPKNINYQFLYIIAVAVIIVLLFSIILNRYLHRKVKIGTAALEKQRKNLEDEIQTQTKILKREIAASNMAQKISRIGYFEHFFQTDVLTGSSSYLEIFETNKDEHQKYQDFIKIVHPKDRDHLVTQIAALSKTSPNYKEEYRVILPSGVKYILGQGMLQCDDDGNPEYMLGTIQDISKSKIISREFDRLNQINVTSLKIAKAASWHIDYLKFPNRIFCSEDCYQLLGYSLGENESFMPFDYFKENILKTNESFGKSTLRGIEEAIKDPSKECNERCQFTRASDNQLRWFKVHIHTEQNQNHQTVHVYGVFQDITNQVTREQKIIESEANLNKGQKIARIGSWHWNINENTIYWSEEAFRLYGVTPHDKPISYDFFIQHIEITNRIQFHANMQSCLSTGKPLSRSTWVVREDGEKVYLKFQAEVSYNKKGEPERIVGTCQDITARKQAEDDATKAHSLANISLEMAKAGSWYAEQPNLNNIYITEGLKSILGIIPVEGKEENILSLQKWAENITETNKIAAHETLEKYQKALSTPSHNIILTWQYTRETDDKVIWCKDSIKINRDQDQNIISIMGVCQDITSQKEVHDLIITNQRLLSESQRIAKVGSWKWIKATDQHLWSAETYRILGVDKQTPNLHDVFGIFTAENQRVMKSKIAHSCETGEPYHFQSWIDLNNGNRIFIDAKAETVTNEKGEITSLSGTVQDITELKIAEEEAKRAKALSDLSFNLSKAGAWSLDLIKDPDNFIGTKETFDIIDSPENSKPITSSVEKWKENILQANHKTGTETIRLLDKAIKDPRFKFDHSYQFIREEDQKKIWLRSCLEVTRDKNLKATFIHGVSQDITDQVNIGEAILETQRVLTETQRISKLGSWELDLATNKVVCTDQAYRNFGLEPQSIELTLENMLELIEPSEREFTKKEISRCLENGEVYSIEHTMLPIDGKTHYLAARGELIYSEEGKPTHLVGYCQDITSRRIREEELKKAKELSDLSLSLAKAGSYTIDFVNSSDTAYATKEAMAIIGIDVPDTGGTLHVKDWEQNLLATDKELGEKTINCFNTAIANKVKSHSNTWFLTRKNDKKKVYLESIADITFAEDGSPLFLRAVIRDITVQVEQARRLKESEERLKPAMVDAT